MDRTRSNFEAYLASCHAAAHAESWKEAITATAQIIRQEMTMWGEHYPYFFNIQSDIFLTDYATRTLALRVSNLRAGDEWRAIVGLRIDGDAILIVEALRSDLVSPIPQWEFALLEKFIRQRMGGRTWSNT